MVLHRHQQAYDGVAALTGRLARHPARRGPRPARRERRRQVDPDGRRVRHHAVPTAAPSRSRASRSTCSTPAVATELGIAIVHQHPAVLPDMTVAENIRVAVPQRVLGAAQDERRRDASDARRRRLDGPPRRPGRLAHASRRSTCSSWPRRSSSSRRLLILDEPTAPLGQDAVDLLFDLVRAAAAARHRRRLHHPPAGRGPRARRPGHRAARRQAARHRARSTTITDDELLALIVGRAARLHLPAQADPTAPTTRPVLTVESLTGPGFSDVSFDGAAAARSSASPASSATVRAHLLRALAGLEPFTGTVHIGERALRRASSLRRHVGVPAGRPAPRGPDDDPLGARERRGLGAARLPPRDRC